jgi:hypothetical protein
MVKAAECAMADNAPLLFDAKDGTQPPILEQLFDSWGKARTRKPAKGRHVRLKLPPCSGRPPPDLHTLTGNEEVLPTLMGVTPKPELGKFVVFAASKDPSVPRDFGSTYEGGDLPDVAVGLALAAHIARARPKLGGVSLVVVPEYLEADPALENDLRAQTGEVLGGIVLGGPGRISEDTRTLLRQILRPPAETGALAALQSSLGDTAGVIAAILALLVGGAAGIAAVDAVRNIVDSKGEVIVTSSGSDDQPKDGRTATDNTPFDIRERGEPVINVYLSGGGKATGIYKGEETFGGVAFMKLAAAKIAEGGEEPPAVTETVVTLIPVANIAYTTMQQPPASSGGETSGG